MSFDKLSVEIISLILLNLTYEGILFAEGVCKTWKAIIEFEPNIQIQLFRRSTDRYVPRESPFDLLQPSSHLFRTTATTKCSRRYAYSHPAEGKGVRVRTPCTILLQHTLTSIQLHPAISLATCRVWERSRASLIPHRPYLAPVVVYRAKPV